MKNNILIEWETESGLSKQTLAIKQSFFAILFSLFLVYVFVISLEIFDGYLTFESFLAISKGFFYIVLFMIFLLIITFLLFFRNYQYSYIINEDGIISSSGKKQYNKNSIINFLLLIAAFFSRSPGAAGTALLAQSRQSIHVDWQDIHDIKVNHKKHIINLKGKWITIIDIHCTAENFSEVLRLIQVQVEKNKNNSPNF